MSVIWDVRLPLDLFLGGVGVGAFLLAVALSRDEKYKELAKIGAYLAPSAVLLGVLIMITELGQPIRMMTTYWFRANPSSAFGWGGWLQTLFIVVSAAYAWMWYKERDESLRNTIGYIGAFLAIAVGAYHGVLLSLVEGTRPLWNAVVPALFITSALATGMAAVMLIGAIKIEALDNTKKLTRPLTFILGTQGFLLLIYLLSLSVNHSPEAVLGMQALVSGGYSMAFWFGSILLGLLVPLGLVAYSQSGTAMRFAALLILVGGFFLRYSVMMAGQVVPIPW